MEICSSVSTGKPFGGLHIAQFISQALQEIALFHVLESDGKQARLTLVWEELPYLLTGLLFFPIQILLGLLAGWFIWKHFNHSKMLWVWVPSSADSGDCICVCFNFHSRPHARQ
jgi:hypothetical protein